MNLLVLAAAAVDANFVRSALGAEVEGAQVLVVSPARNESRLAFWVSDADEAIQDARERADATAADLREDGLSASATTGESEPLTALQDALATFAADKVLVVVRPEDRERYRRDDVVGEAERRFGVPVVEATAGA